MNKDNKDVGSGYCPACIKLVNLSKFVKLLKEKKKLNCLTFILKKWKWVHLICAPAPKLGMSKDA